MRIETIEGVRVKVWDENEKEADFKDEEVPCGRVRCKWQTVCGMSPMIGYVGVITLGCKLLQVIDYKKYGYQHILCSDGNKPLYCPLRR